MPAPTPLSRPRSKPSTPLPQRGPLSLAIVGAILGAFGATLAHAEALAPPPVETASPSSPAAVRKDLVVSVSPIAAYVEKKADGTPTGFTIDLIREIARTIDRPVRFVWSENVGQTLAAVQAGRVDVGAGAISVTKEREARIDFTHAYAQSGLGMAIRAQTATWWSRLTSMMTKGRLTIIASFFLLIFVAGHLIWVAERGKDAFSDRYFPGVFEGMYWAIVTASTVGYGDKAPVKWAGRALAGLVIIISLPMFAVFTAELTSALTTSELEGQISGPTDLGHRSVGVVSGTTSAIFARRVGLTTLSFSSGEKAMDALRRGEVDAVIYDEAPLRNLVRKSGRKAKLRVVDRTFETTPVALAIPVKSELTEALNRAVLELVQDGEVARLHDKWLGGSGGS